MAPLIGPALRGLVRDGAGGIPAATNFYTARAWSQTLLFWFDPTNATKISVNTDGIGSMVSPSADGKFAAFVDTDGPLSSTYFESSDVDNCALWVLDGAIGKACFEGNLAHSARMLALSAGAEIASTGAAFSYMMLVKGDDYSGDNYLWGKPNAYNMRYGGNAYQMTLNTSNASYSVAGEATHQIIPAQWTVVYVRHRDADGRSYIRVNGSAEQSGNWATNNVGVQIRELCGHRDFATSHQGRIAFMAFWDGQSSADDRAAAYAWITTNFGIDTTGWG